MNKQKNIIVIILVLILAGVVGYFAFVKESLDVLQKTDSPFINNSLGLEFTLPKGYIVNSNHYGVTDASEADAFYFRKESTDYRGVPNLDISINTKLPSGQTLQQFAQSVYEMNKAKNYTTSELKRSNYGGIETYEFGLKTGYTDPAGYQLLDSTGGKVVFLYQNDKLFKILLTGSDPGLTSILNSLKLK